MTSFLPEPVLETVRRSLVSLEGIEKGIIVAVSGGADSVCLLRLLHAVLPSHTPIIVAHLNHLLRGKESDRDEEFVAHLSCELQRSFPGQIFYESKRTDVGSMAQEQNGNLEATARNLRYEWLADVAQKYECIWVATGHTADDQAETLLHRLIRGSGIQGLRGIHPKRSLRESVSLVRPLLQIRRDLLIQCLQILGQTWCEDHTNNDLDFTRNRIRHELLPLLKNSFNPGIAEVLARIPQQVEDLMLIEETFAKDLLHRAELPRAGQMVCLDAQKMKEGGRHGVRAAFRILCQKENWLREGMSFAVLERLADLVFGERPALDIPGGIHVRRRGRTIQMGLQSLFYP